MNIGHFSRSNDEDLASLLAQLGDLLASSDDLSAFFEASIRMIEQVLQVEGCSIFLLDPRQGVLRVKAAKAIPRTEWPSIQIRLGEGIVGQVAQTGEILQSRDIARMKEHQPAGGARHAHYKTASFISVPVKFKGQTIGVINVDSKRNGGHFSSRDARLLQGMAGLFATALEHSRLLDEHTRASRHFHSILQSVPMGVMAFDKSLRLAHCNRAAAEILGIDPLAVQDQAVHLIFSDFLRPRIIELITELRVTGIAACTEVQLNAIGEGRALPVGLSVWSLDQTSGLREGVVLLIEDLTLRHEIVELRQLSELKSDFLSLISHELRTPLTPVITSLHLLEKNSANLDEIQKRVLGIIERNVRRLAAVVEDILEVQRIETEHTELNAEPVELETLLGECLERLRLAWKEKEAHVRIETEGLPPLLLRLDRDRMRQVFKHLLDNAFKFCRINGNVWVKITRAANRVEVRIGNCGPVIPMKYRDQIFDKFYQVESTMTRQFGGPGLGLYLARQLVRLHGGEVVLEKSNEEATVFLVNLPWNALVENPPVAPETTAAPAAERMSHLD